MPDSHPIADSMFKCQRKPLLILDYKDVFKGPNNFTKGCKWAPDGSCLLVPSEDQQIRIFRISETILQGSFNNEAWLIDGFKSEINPVMQISEKEMVYDYAWFPLMNIEDLQSSCFAVTCRDMPVHLWNGCTGQIIGSYFSYNHLEQLVAAHSVSFSPDGHRLLCGYKKSLKAFDVSRPGKISTEFTSKGFTGIFSCLAFHPKLTNIFAAGSYTGSIGLFNVDQQANFAIFEGHTKGVTHIQFSDDGLKLFSGTRKDNEILCWDMRQPGKIFSVFKRDSLTNQRIYFDVTSDSKQLVSGSTSGDVFVYDLEGSFPEISSSEPPELGSMMTFKVHNDVANGIALHPFSPLMATSSGHRIIQEPEIASSQDSDSDEKLVNLNAPENTVKLWWLNDIN